MILNIKPVLRGDSGCLEFDFSLAPSPADFAGGDAEFPEDARVYGCVKNEAGIVTLDLKLTLDYTAPCARCLEIVGGKLKAEYSAVIDSGGDGGAAGNALNGGRPGEYADAPGGMLDLGEIAREQIDLAFPWKILCREDCPGLCPVCGKQKSDGAGDCGCPQKKTDPRLEILKKLLDK